MPERGRQHAIVGVLAFRVVKHLDIFEHVPPCSVACEVSPPPDALPFQELEEALCDSIVMTITTTAHVLPFR